MARDKGKKNRHKKDRKGKTKYAANDPKPAMAIDAPQPVEDKQQPQSVNDAGNQHDNGKRSKVSQWCQRTTRQWGGVLRLFFTASIATFALVQIFVGGCQWGAMKEQYGEMKRSNDIADATAKKQLRAYVNILTDLDPTVRFYRKIEGHPLGQMVMIIKVKNSGQTPAHRVTEEYDGKYLRTGITEGTYPPDALNREGAATMGPGREWTLTIPYSLEPSDENPETGRQTFWAVGRIEYRDAFDEIHHTNFRYRQIFDGPGADEWKMEITDNGNDSN